MAYDRADWHSGGNFPKDLPDDAGGTHIGLFLAWAIMNELEGEVHREDCAEDLAAVRSRQMTGRDFFFKACDGKLWDDDFNDIGNAFAKRYYGRRYFEDYERTLTRGLPSMYHAPDTWESYDLIAPVITKRFQRWQAKRGQPWWKFW